MSFLFAYAAVSAQNTKLPFNLPFFTLTCSKGQNISGVEIKNIFLYLQVKPGA